jgi:glutathione S-transferase
MLTLYLHPLASFCHKVLIALYENDTPFEAKIVDFADPGDSARFLDVWPVGKIPVLRDEARGRTIPETSIILEYLDENYPGPVCLLPGDAEAALDVRLWDRFFDLYIHQPMQKIVIDRIRPPGTQDAHGVAEAKAGIAGAYAMLDRHLAGREWASGKNFSMADCAAAPALFYSGIPVPFTDYPNVAAYFERLYARPSFRRVLDEARPYFGNYPLKDDMPERFL